MNQKKMLKFLPLSLIQDEVEHHYLRLAIELRSDGLDTHNM